MFLMCIRYGELHMVYNTHLLVHISRKVNNFGPLKNFSCWPFEKFNGVFSNTLFGTSNYLSQISKGLRLLKIACIAEEVCVVKFCLTFFEMCLFREYYICICSKIVNYLGIYNSYRTRNTRKRNYH
jgi:hypothetical protein